MKIQTPLLILFYFVYSMSSIGQNLENQRNSSIEPRDSQIAYSPAVAAFALKKFQSELNVITTISPVTSIFDFGKAPFTEKELQTPELWFAGSFKYMYGISTTRNLNIGLRARFSMDLRNSEDFGAGIGPVIRWRPFGELKNGFDFTLEHHLNIPINTFKGLSLAEITDWGNDIQLTKYFFDRNVLLMASASFNLNSKSSSAYDFVKPIRTPVSLLIGYYPRRNFLLFSSLRFLPTFGTVAWKESNERFYRERATHLQLGFQYVLFNRYSFFGGHELELEKRYGGVGSFSYLGFRVLIL